MFSKIFQGLKIITFLSLIATIFTFLPANAELNEVDLNDPKFEFAAQGDGVSFYPCESDPGVPQSKSWFILEAQPGETLEVCSLLANGSNEEATVLVRAEDGVQSSGGGFGMGSENKEPTGTGTWIELVGTEEIVTLQPGKGIEIPLKITIPENTEPGEYGLAVSNMPTSTEEGGSNFQIKRRFGTRIYITVGNDDQLNQGTRFDRFEFLTGESEFYTEFQKARAFAWDDIIMTWDPFITGNIFSKLEGTYKITAPDGSIFEQEFSKDFFPKQSGFQQFVETKAKWQGPGTYKARFDFTNTPVIPWNKPENLPDISEKNFVETEITMTQEMLDKLEEGKRGKVQTGNEEGGNKNSGPAAGVVRDFEEPAEKVEQDDEDKNSALYIGLGVLGGIILIALIVVIVILLKKKKDDKSEKKEEVKSESGSSDKTEKETTSKETEKSKK